MHVVVVGAGLSGLILSLQLARAGIKCSLLDCGHGFDERPRGAHYSPAAVQELRRAGVLEDVRALSFTPGDVCWRKLDHSIIVKVKDSSQANSPDALTVLPLPELGNILLRHTKRYHNLHLYWNHVVDNFEQNASSVTVVGTKPGGLRFEIKADYLCGADGDNSTIQNLLYGNPFEGKTWPTQIIATNIYYPMHEMGLGDINYVMHPEHYFMAAKIAKDGLWQVLYGEPADMSIDEIMRRQPLKFEIMLPSNPKPDQYRVTSCIPYRIHQRCADRFRVGRVLLLADAAHLCNPFGDWGISGGIVDAGGLSQCLIGIAQRKTDAAILHKYDEVRRSIWHKFVNPLSTANFTRISSNPDIIGMTDELIVQSRVAWEDPQVLQKQHDSAYAICHDFSQYFDDPTSVKGQVSVQSENASHGQVFHIVPNS